MSEEKEMKKIKQFIKDEWEKRNIVIAGFEGLGTVKIDKFINQHVDSILYDLNRSEEVVLTNLTHPKWVNDFAVAKVIRALKNEIEKLKTNKPELTELYESFIYEDESIESMNDDNFDVTKKYIKWLENKIKDKAND